MSGMIHNEHLFVYQIYYDEQSRMNLDPGFIPLNNTANKRPDWFEFWVIRNFLKNTTLQENAWYGFLSPRFGNKTGLNAAFVLDTLNRFGDDSDVALFSPGWDQLAYFLNPFEQGEAWHPGLMRLCQDFFDKVDVKVELASLVTHSATSVFCNYQIAKRPFWHRWLWIADQFFDFVEAQVAPGPLRQATSYGSGLNQAPMKTFIQERFASVILSQGNFKTLVSDQSQSAPIFARLFGVDPQTRRMLQTCDLLKREYCRSQDDDYLKMYKKIRDCIPFTAPI